MGFKCEGREYHEGVWGYMSFFVEFGADVQVSFMWESYIEELVG